MFISEDTMVLTEKTCSAYFAKIAFSIRVFGAFNQNFKATGNVFNPF